MLSHDETPKLKSVAGTWGEEQLSKMVSEGRLSPRRKNETKINGIYYDMMKGSHEANVSVTKYMFSDKFIKLDKEFQQNKFAKFKKLKEKTPMILDYGEHGAPASLIDEPIKTQSNDLSTTIDKSLGDRANYMTESSIIMGYPGKRSINLLRTQTALMKTDDAPIAFGRSGRRKEKGLQTTGLMGEKLNLSNNRSVNTLVQRSWMYVDDPAIKYKLEGIKPIENINGLSLPIGELTDDIPFVKEGSDFRRKVNITGGPLTRGTGVGRIFLDYPEDIIQ